MFSNRNLFQRETRALIRGGIPSSLRSTVWRFLIHQKVADRKELYGRHYYRNLCSLQGGERDSLVSNSGRFSSTLGVVFFSVLRKPSEADQSGSSANDAEQRSFHVCKL